MKQKEKGFLLIGLVIAIAIIAIIFTVLNGGDKKQTTENLQTQKLKAEEQILDNNAKLNNYQDQLEAQ